MKLTRIGREWQPLIAIGISLLSVGLVIYQQFLRGPNLSAWISQVGLLHLNAEQIKPLLPEILLDDIYSNQPSLAARAVLKAHGDALDPACGRDQLRLDPLRLATQIQYQAPDEITRRYIGYRYFFPKFHIPLVVSNDGARVGHISSLVLLARGAAGSQATWAFATFTEVRPEALLPSQAPPTTDIAQSKGILAGITIPPNMSIRHDPLFLPHHDGENRIISRSNIMPGEYGLTIYGYNAGGDEVLRTNTVRYILTEEAILNMFKGVYAVQNSLIERDISKAVESQQ